MLVTKQPSPSTRANRKELLDRGGLVARELGPAAPERGEHRVEHRRADDTLDEIGAVKAVETVDAQHASLLAQDLIAGRPRRETESWFDRKQTQPAPHGKKPNTTTYLALGHLKEAARVEKRAQGAEERL